MKIHSLIIGVLVFLFVNCSPSKPDIEPLRPTEKTDIFNQFSFDIPIGFVKESNNTWVRNSGKQISRIYIDTVKRTNSIDEEYNKFLKGSMNLVYSGDVFPLKQKSLESINDSQLKAKVGIYTMNHNQGSMFKINSGHCVGIITKGNIFIRVRSASLGYPMSETIKQSIINCKP